MNLPWRRFLPNRQADRQACDLDRASAWAQQRYLEGNAKDERWWDSLDSELERLARAAMRARVEAL